MTNQSATAMAFSEDQVQRLTGLSKWRLRYWDRTGFYRPGFAYKNRRVAYSRIYSFKDVVALRTLSVLRKEHNVSLQHLREVAEKLKYVEDEAWADTVLYVVKRRVHIYNKDTGNIESVMEGQAAFDIIRLEAIENDVKTLIGELRRRSQKDIGRVTRSRYRNRNAWVVAGTRIPVSAIKSFAEEGYSEDAIIKEYPSLTHADVKAAIKHEGNGAAA